MKFLTFNKVAFALLLGILFLAVAAVYGQAPNTPVQGQAPNTPVQGQAPNTPVQGQAPTAPPTEGTPTDRAPSNSGVYGREVYIPKTSEQQEPEPAATSFSDGFLRNTRQHIGF